MSWFFLIGQLVYWCACPEIVRKYANFGAYHADHAGDGKLRGFIHVAEGLGSERVAGELAEPTSEWGDKAITAPFDTPENRAHLSSRLAHMLNRTDRKESQEERRNLVFDALLAAGQYARRTWFWVSGAFFAGGIALFARVVVDGAIEVWRLL